MNFDANPDLLGGEQSVLELCTGVVRSPQLTDYISKSVGYNIHQTLPDDQWDAITSCMAKIYPHDDERRLVQQFAGCSLRGDHQSGRVLVLTDRRGGSSGKTTVLNLLKLCLGPQYSQTGNKGLIYKVRHSVATNGHNSGIAASQGVRFATFEEPSLNTSLNTSLLKALNGGNASLSGVKLEHSVETRQMTWTTKMAMVFSEADLPKLQVDDPECMGRMLVVQHRSCFCDTQERVAQENRPFTYLTDRGAIEKLTPQAVLVWAMEGLARYYDEEFSYVSRSCESW